MDQKIKNLLSFAQGIYKKENGKELYNKYLSEIQSITPQEVFLVEFKQLEMGLTPAQLLPSVDKLINVFYKSLKAYSWKKPDKGTFIYYLMEENKGLLNHLEEFKAIIKRQSYEEDRERIQLFLQELMNYNNHLVKLENILFPYMQKKMERYDGLKIMWSIHDETRRQLKALIKMTDNELYDVKSFNVDIGQLFFKLHGLVQKQELIMFPAATEIISEEEFEAMHNQSFDYHFPFIDAPDKPDKDVEGHINRGEYTSRDSVIKTATGALTFEQMELMINTLPIDMTFVDANDKVAFFNKPKDRFFPRSVAVIGRDVRQCHPHESVHVVETILENFREGIKDQESFWIQMKGLFILIQYFAVRNEDGIYLGTLEVSQEISGIRELEGENRLLDD